MGAPKKFLSDNGGEFANEEFRDMAENLNIEIWNTAGYSPWQNGLCERNHAVVDNCVEKILEDYPNMDIELALVWAVNAKNSLQMVIIQAEASEKIRRALRHKIRSSGEVYQPGDKVFYKRDGSTKWRGPGKVLGQDGKVVFVRHGSVYVRVHPCRLTRVGEEFNRSSESDLRHELPNEGNDVGSQHESKSEVEDMPVHPTVEEDDNVDIPQTLQEMIMRKEMLTEINIKFTRGTEYTLFKHYQRHEEAEVKLAKNEELTNWTKFQVYKEIEDCGQPAISTRWVITEKSVDGKKIAKARLVARGFEEQKCVQADSPTVSKETLKVFLALASTHSWRCHSIDIKAAFLQEVDLALFYWHHGDKLSGMLIMHVDDFLWAGTEDFKKIVVDKIKSAFKIGKEAEGAFRYIGLEIAHDVDGIVLTQNSYIESITEIPVPAARVAQKEFLLKQSEVTQLRGAIGQVQWASNQTRPDISYDALELSTTTKEPKVKDLLQANKVIKKIKMKQSHILFPNLGDQEQLRLVVYCDASYANYKMECPVLVVI
ncbi:hypothetical protein BSL78_23810 [Apostichopus japonicus]|uniref:Integrase catalytic domain-containing protein n=1 Tax=Stichopus japonicus TaxID=307972 RepID=A0A2G8JUA5_STIJA|nr:hypothetical protein BSL78_23810 [Apostichopus japonicus]